MGVSKYRGGPPKWMVKIMENTIKMDDLGGKTPYFWKHPYKRSPPLRIPGLVNDHIKMAGMTSPFSIGNISAQSGFIFQPAMLVYRSVQIEQPKKGLENHMNIIGTGVTFEF